MSESVLENNRTKSEKSVMKFRAKIEKTETILKFANLVSIVAKLTPDVILR